MFCLLTAEQYFTNCSALILLSGNNTCLVSTTLLILLNVANT